MPRSIDDLVARADELADEFEGSAPQESDRGEPALLALRRAAYRRVRIERELVERVLQAREAGESWTKIGNELGTSGEAARQRYGRRVDACPDRPRRIGAHVVGERRPPRRAPLTSRFDAIGDGRP